MCPDLSLWFLWVLFIIHVAYYAGHYVAYLVKINNKLVVLIAIYLTLQGISFFVKGLFGFWLASDYFLFFSIGVLLGQYKNQLPAFHYSKLLTLLSVAFFAIMVSFWYRNASQLPDTCPSLLRQINKLKIYQIFVASLGSITFVLMSARYLDKMQIKSITYLGRNTLGIYAIHQTVVWGINQFVPNSVIAFNQTYLGGICSFIVVMLITIIILQLIKMNNVCSRLFIGSK